MVAAYEMHVRRVLDLEGQEEADGLQAVRPPIHIVALQQAAWGSGMWRLPTISSTSCCSTRLSSWGALPGRTQAYRSVIY